MNKNMHEHDQKYGLMNRKIRAAINLLPVTVRIVSGDEDYS